MEGRGNSESNSERPRSRGQRRHDEDNEEDEDEDPVGEVEEVAALLTARDMTSCSKGRPQSEVRGNEGGGRQVTEVIEVSL